MPRVSHRTAGGSRAGTGSRRGRVLAAEAGLSRRVVAPPTPGGGRESCPVCRNVASVTARGYLRRHRDLFGHDCWNVARREDETKPAVVGGSDQGEAK